jgi:hypothetical protein
MKCKKSEPEPPVEATKRRERRTVQGMEQGGAWRAEVGARIAELEDRLAAAPVDPTSSEGQAIRESVDAELDRAHTAAGHGLAPSVPAWWTGSSITKGWEAVHNAELALLRIETDDAVLTAVPRLFAWIESAMDAGVLRKAHEDALNAEMAKKEGDRPDRTKICGALMDVIKANGERYLGVRTFRNNLILVTVALAACLVGLAIWHANNHEILSLCVEKKGKLKECLGGGKPSSSDVWLVLGMGVLGGLLGIAFRLSQGETAARFDPKTWQRLLKPVTGAATALAAVLFLQAHLLIELSTQRTKLVLLSYALVFGFSQQVLTKFVDKRAESLITPK